MELSGGIPTRKAFLLDRIIENVDSYEVIRETSGAGDYARIIELRESFQECLTAINNSMDFFESEGGRIHKTALNCHMMLTFGLYRLNNYIKESCVNI